MGKTTNKKLNGERMYIKNLKQLMIFPLIIPLIFLSGCNTDRGGKSQIKAAAAAVKIEVSDTLPLGGGITPRQPGGTSDGPLRVQVIMLTDGISKVCLGSCDVANLRRTILDEIGKEIETRYNIPFDNFMFAATHNHTAPVQDWSYKTPIDSILNNAIKKAIMEAVGLANEKLISRGATDFYFALGYATIGQNSRVVIDDSTILWVPLSNEYGYNRPTGPYDPQLPVLAFKDSQGNTEAIVFNHSTHNINNPNNVHSPSFYGTASQEIEKELGGTVVFLPGAFGSTHVFSDPTEERTFRIKEGIEKAYAKSEKRIIQKLVSVKKEFEFEVRTFDEDEEQKTVSNYCNRFFSDPEDIIQGIKNRRDHVAPFQGKIQKTWIQVILVGDIAFVGVPGELFAELGNEIKRRSPFRYTYVVGIANDYIGYLPDDEAFNLGGYQTWAGRAYSKRGTGEAIVNETVKMLNDLYQEKE
jgi:hypothetical protein